MLQLYVLGFSFLLITFFHHCGPKEDQHQDMACACSKVRFLRFHRARFQYSNHYEHQKSWRIIVMCYDLVLEQKKNGFCTAFCHRLQNPECPFHVQQAPWSCKGYTIELEARLGTGTYKSLSYALSKSSSSSIPGPNSPKTGCQAPMSATYSKQPSR